MSAHGAAVNVSLLPACKEALAFLPGRVPDNFEYRSAAGAVARLINADAEDKSPTHGLAARLTHVQTRTVGGLQLVLTALEGREESCNFNRAAALLAVVKGSERERRRKRRCKGLDGLLEDVDGALTQHARWSEASGE